MATLKIEGEGLAPLQVELEPGQYAFGSAAENALIIEHPTLSPHHGDLTVQDDGRIMVADAGSETGLWVDGEPVAQAVIAPGQAFQAGGLRFTLAAPVQVPLPPRFGVTSPSLISPSKHAPPVSKPPAATFLGEIPDALAYPFRGEAYLYIVVVMALFIFQYFLSRVGMFLGPAVGLLNLLIELVIGCYLFLLWQQVVATTVNGDDRFPDFPQMSLDWGENISLFLHYVALVMICFLPVFIVRFLNALGAGLPDGLITAGLVFGFGYFPMAFLGFVLTDSLAVLRPDFIIRSIWRRPGDYLVVVGLLALCVKAGTSLDTSVSAFSFPPLLRAIISAVTGGIGLYFVFVWMRLLGLFYRRNRDRLAWI